MKKRTRIGALLMAVVMIFSLTTVSFAEAGQWDPLTDPETVKGTLYDNKTSYASTQFERGKPGALRMMPTYTEGGYVYNASAYCGATATSDNPDVVEVKTKDGHQDIVIGKWVGGIWDGADCLQVNVDAKKAGTATVQVNFYYTFTQNNDPFNHPKALWIYGTCYYTVTVTDTSQQDITLTYDGNGSGVTNVPAQQKQNVTQGDSATFTISSTIPVRSGFDFLGWADSATATAAEYHGGNSLTTNTSKTIYAVWKTHEHSDKNGDGFCDTDHACMHPKDANGYCTVEGCTHPDSCCPKKEAPKPPTEPTGTPTFTDVNGQIRVQCTAYPSNHEPHALKYGITSKDDYTVIGQAQKGDTFTYSIELKRASFIDKFDAATKREHEDVEPNEKAIVTWRWDDDKWNLISGPDGITADIKCICKKEIEPPTDGPTDDDVKAALGNVTVTVKCINPGTKHTSCAYGVLGGNDGYQLTKNKDGTYNVVLNAAPFVKAYSSGAQTQKQAHELVSAATLTWVLTFDKESGKWVGAPKVIGVDDTILVTHAPKDYKEVGKIADKDDVITTKCVNSNKTANKFGITVGFTPNVADKLTVVYTGNGTYKATFSVENCVTSITKDNGRCTHTERQHDLLTKELVTWLLSVKVDGKGGYVWSAEPKTPGEDDVCNVAHRVKVTFDENYENASTTDVMYKYNTAEVKEGTIPTAPDRTGYTFKGWNTKKDGTGETFNAATFVANADVTYYAQWEINTYIIAATLYMNGADSSVQETGKTYPWSHRYGGKFEETIDYTEMFAALKAKALEVDAANEPYDAEIKLCFPKSEELFNEKIMTYGQDGASWNPGVKNTAYIWGHATTSYEVIFNTGDGSKVDTQIVKYGELATEPTTKLKGYDFLGWFDADGNEFDFDTPITHKTTLTAKWEKKTYIIASNLRINGGDANLADGKTYPWSYRYGGKFEETIDYREMFDALKTRAMKVDEANGPVDSVVTLCFPGDYPATAKKLFNDTILTYGQDGGGWNPGNKNTAPIWGFATNVYAVTFNYKDDKTATATQNVEYGNMATEPQKVDRPGYRFLGWFTEDGKAFDFSTPITKSMTLTAKWEIVNINAYIIPITSDGTQLVGAGFDMALNTTTLGRVGLPGYEDEDAVRIHFATFASSAGLADADDYFPGTDPLVVKAVADLKNGLERRFAAGVNEAKADGIMSKTNWTYLHVGELDDEDDTNFLSGNLVFYSARFVTEDSEHVTGMPNAEYTHNAVAVYDYYLDGETITIPDAVPERYGYDFLGWSVKAVPAENDKLLKAGDTVTVDGDVVFTAQWKLKEYTVSFDSKGGTKVDSQIVEHGSTATKPGNPHRNDYTFKGWYLDGKKFDFSTPITGDITLVARWATKTSGGSNSSSDTTTKDNGKTVQSGKTFDGGIALYVGLSVLSATGSALVITKKKRG